MPVPIHSQEPSQILLNHEQRQSLLDSLKFKQIDAGQRTIKTAHAKTCRWLLKSEQYLNWLDTTRVSEHHGFLWIKGKAGTGKSTLMKFALVNARKTMKDYIVLSFFFNARGADIERSTIGIYQSLLLQLLERLPALQSVFDLLSLSTSSFSADHQWNIESLETLLEQAIRGLGDSFVVCFIDALDECEEEQVREMIQFFKHIGNLAVLNGIRFQVCFSSRHYPYIAIRNGLELVLEGQEGHSQDITNYIETELEIGKSKIAQRVRADLQEKASGIFMWVVLVVGILNKESDRGKIHTLQQKLQEIPGDLHKLFRDILTRDSHDKDELVLCIQWVLFAKHPLSPEQLYHAIYAGTNPRKITDWDPEENTKDVVKRLILSSSKGLAEVTESKEPKAQFIHESVRDFLLKENGLGKIWPELGSNFPGKSHERLKQCCLNYISIDVAVPLKIPDDLPKATLSEAASLRKSATQRFPFLEYAVRNILYHAETAAGEGISQASFLDSFPLPRWVKLDNLFEKHKVRRHTEHLSLLYLLAELNFANLIGVVDSVSSCMVVGAERYGCPLFAAAAMSSEQALEVCMASIEVRQADSSPAAALDERRTQHKSAQRTARRDYVYSRSKDFSLNAAELGHDGVLMLLIRLGELKIDSKDSRDRTVLWWASKNGCERAVRSLLDTDPAMVSSKDKDDQNSLYTAAEQGNKAVVVVLLEKGADVNARGGHYHNALQAASARGHEQTVKMLLDKGANVNEQGGEYGNALQAASARGHEQVVKTLLDKGANVKNAQGGEYCDALLAASAGGHEQVVKTLLDKGAKVNAQGGLYSNALQTASAGGHEQVVKTLLDKGANVNAQGGEYGNALQAASAGGQEQVGKMLLDKDANVNAQGGRYGDALQAASYGGHQQVVKTLLDNGANINAEGGHYGNALQTASYGGHQQVVKTLLDKGANVNALGGHYGNALQAAVLNGYKQVVKMLLDKRANVNAQGGRYHNALQAASYGGHQQVVKMLLDKDANVNAQGGRYGDALQAASYKGYQQVVKTLLDNGANVNAQGGRYGNALQAASAGGHEKVVKILVAAGAY
jgi:ankyrin repeat protein